MPTRLVEQQIQRHALFGRPSPEAEHFAVTTDQLHPLLGVHPAERIELPPSSRIPVWHGRSRASLEVDLTLGEQRVDLLGGDVELGHARPAGGDDVLGVVFVGGQADRAGLDPQRNVLAHQGDSLALGGEVRRAGQDPRVVAVGAEAGGQHRRVAVVELDLQRAALRADRNRLIEPAVFEPQIVEHAECLPGEPAEFVVVPFGFQFTDDHQRDDDFVFGESRAGPRIGQQHGGVEHIGPNGRISHVALPGRMTGSAGRPCGTARSLSAGAAVPGPGPVPFRSQRRIPPGQQSMSLAIEFDDTPARGESRLAGAPGATIVDERRRVRRASVRPSAAMRRRSPVAAVGTVENAGLGDDAHACPRRRRCRRRRAPGRPRASAMAATVSSRLVAPGSARPDW